MNKTLLVSLLAALAALAALGRDVPQALAFLGLGDSHETLALVDGAAHVPLSDVKGKAAAFYSVEVDGTTVSFFVLATPDGVIRTAFDACDVCFAAGKGYGQDGTDMVCKNCGLRFPGDMVGEARGGCNPSPLPHAVQDGRIVIAADDLRQGLRLFRGVSK